MSDNSQDPLNCEAADLQACRGCLAMYCKLYDICEKQLEQVFSDLIGLPVSEGFLCSTCLHLLYKFKAFRVRCRHSGHILNHMFSLNEDVLSSVDRTNLAPLSQSKMSYVTCESTRTRELFMTDVQLIDIPNENTIDLKNDLDVLIKLEDISQCQEFNSSYDNKINKAYPVNEVVSLKDTDGFKVFANEIEFKDVTHSKTVENEDDDKMNVDDAAENDINNDDDDMDAYVDDSNFFAVRSNEELKSDDNKKPVVKRANKRERSKIEMCKYFIYMWKAISKVKGNYYEMFERLYQFNQLEQRPEIGRFKKKENKSEVYIFAKFSDYFKEIADAYKVDVEFISISEERRAMEEKRKTLAGDADHCGLCCKKYVKAGTRARHMKLAHNEAHSFRCEVCHYSFKLESLLVIHLFKFHTTKKRCRECGQAILTLGVSGHWHEVNDHIDMHHKGTVTTCEFCGRTFTASKHCLDHIRQAHSTVMRNAVHCWLCGDTYNGIKGLQAHAKKIHTETVRCGFCKVFFLNKDAVSAHLAETGKCRKDVSACPMCGATFLTEDAMKEHYDEIHAKHKCKKCGRTFISYDSYRMHHYKVCSDGERLPRLKKETKHTNRTGQKRKIGVRNSYQINICHICGKGFRFPALLTYHMRVHTGEKPFECEHCDKRFRTPSLLKLHTVTHTDERRYKCLFCHKAFRQQSHLDAHKACHSKEKNHACSMCSKRYTTSASLYMHVRTVHRGLPPPPRNRNKKQAQPQNI